MLATDLRMLTRVSTEADREEGAEHCEIDRPNEARIELGREAHADVRVADGDGGRISCAGFANEIEEGTRCESKRADDRRDRNVRVHHSTSFLVGAQRDGDITLRGQPFRKRGGLGLVVVDHQKSAPNFSCAAAHLGSVAHAAAPIYPSGNIHAKKSSHKELRFS